MMCQNLERILDKEWLRNNPNHPYNQWIMKPEDSREKLFLSRLDNYVGKANPRLHTKTIQSKLRNSQGFVDTYYELEIGCFLIDNGFDVNLKKTLCDEKSNRITPDIYVEKDNVIVEVKTIHRSFEVEKGLESRRVFTCNEAKRIKDDILSELEKYSGKKITYPLIVIICPDFIKPPLVSPDDFETILLYRCDRWIFNGTLRRTNDVTYRGLYYDGEGRYAERLNGVGLWRQKGIWYYENPNVNKVLKIPSRFLDFLKRF
jgi:hypothetical protein